MRSSGPKVQEAASEVHAQKYTYRYVHNNFRLKLMTFAICRWPPIGPYFPLLVDTESGGVRCTQRGESDSPNLQAQRLVHRDELMDLT